MSLKILGIGNSFTQDSFQWLPFVLDQIGEEDATIAFLYIGGCSLERHCNNISEPTHDYAYFKYDGEEWTERTDATLLEGIKDEPWDIIMFQQKSGLSGKPTSYAFLRPLIEYVDREKTNPDAVYDFNMTWAYQSNSPHKDFVIYGCDQSVMYRAICATVKAIVEKEPMIRKIYPTGTVIQNLRIGSFGDRLTRDGYHLSLIAGRFAAAVGIAYFLGYDINKVTLAPTPEISEEYITEIKHSVKNAAIVPYEVTGI